MNDSGVTVLVVEDNEDIAEVFQMCLEAAGLNVIVAGTIQEACNACRQQPINAMLVDFYLPDGIGPDLLVRLGNTSPKIKILLSGKDIKDLKEQYPGFDEYLSKPVEMEYLLQIFTKVGQKIGVQENESGKWVEYD